MSALKTIHMSLDPIDCGRNFWFICRLYETEFELQRAAYKYTPTEGKEFWDQAAGCFQPSWTAAVDKKGNYVHTSKTSFFGVMRLCEPYLTRDVVIHESVHAAVNLVRALTLDVEFDIGEINNEEAVCFSTNLIACSLLKVFEL